MDHIMTHQQVDCFVNSLQRLREIIATPWAGNETTAAIVTQVQQIIRDFTNLGKTYEEMLLEKVQAIRDLQAEVAGKEKERLGLETRLQDSENTVVAKVQAIRDLQAEVAGKEKERLDLETRLKDSENTVVAKVQAIRDLQAEVAGKEKERLDLETRLKESENIVAAKGKESLDLELRLKTLQDLLVKKDEELEMRSARASEIAKKEREELEVKLRHANDLAVVNELKRLELEMRLKEAENQAMRKEKEKQQLVNTHSDEMRRLKDEMVKVDSEKRKLCSEKATLQEKVRKAKADQFGKVSAQQADLRKQLSTLKGYLQTLAANFSSKEKSNLHDDLHVELRILECMGLEEDTMSYLRVILERILKRSEECVGEKSSHQTGLKRAIEIIDLEDDSETSNHESSAPDSNLDGRRRRRRTS